MANVITTFDGERAIRVILTSVSDGTNEENVVKVDVSALINAPLEVRIASIKYDVAGMGVRLQWQANESIDTFILGNGNSQYFDF